MRTMPSALAAATLLLALAGCGSSDDTTTSSTTTSTTTTATATKTDEGSNDQLASRLCTALSKEVAALEMSNAGEVEAQAQIAITLADVYGDDVAQMDGAKIEAMTKETCPEVHDEALTVLKVGSLDDL